MPLTAPAAGTILPAPTGPLRIGARRGQPLALSVVLPTYNERENIGELVERLTATLHAQLGDSFELIVVDNDSPDRTWEFASDLAQSNPHLCVVRRCGEQGLATAVVRGWQIARGEVLAVMDTDLQHPPEVMPKLWALAQQDGVDLAVASRRLRGGSFGDFSFARRMVSRAARLIGLVFLPHVFRRVSDPMSGCFAVRRSSLENLTLDPRGYKILIELLGRATIRGVGEVGYTFAARRGGRSKATLGVFLDYLLQLLQLRLESIRQRPGRVPPKA